MHTHTSPAPLTALDVIFTRRSIRAFTADEVPEATVRALLDAAVQAPTALHAEPWAFVVIQNAAMLKRLSDRVRENMAGAALPGSIAPAAEAGHHAPTFAERLADPNFCIFYDASTLILICARTSGAFAVADCWLAAENLMLAASALGLGTCCIGSAVSAFTSHEAKVELGMPADVMPVAPIIVGVPRGVTAPATRKDPDVLSWRK